MAKNIVFLLIGSANAGKTNTIREWCERREDKKVISKKGKLIVFITKINDENELVIASLCSPQELRKYDVEEVKKLISNRIKNYNQLKDDNKFPRFIWILPFTVGIKSDKVKKEEVTEAINLLKNKDFQLTKIYLKRTKYDKKRDIEYFKEIDNFVDGIKDYTIESKENDEKRQAEELDKIIEKNI